LESEADSLIFVLCAARLSSDQLRLLLETIQDPEVQPGLFQGDMALTNDMYELWRVGIRWDVEPERMWQNNTVHYVISPLYGEFHRAG
jgi:hypothetical protein